MKKGLIVLILLIVSILFISGCISQKSQTTLPTPTCPTSCDDRNPCTSDFCLEKTNYTCVNENLTGIQTGCSGSAGTCKEYVCSSGTCIIQTLDNCCGNKVCESGEAYLTCQSDCLIPSYLIITHEKFQESVRRLAEYRGHQYNVVVKYIPTGASDKEVKQLIEENFQNSSYVLLIGRCDTVPCHYVIAGNITYSTDNYYADINDDGYPELYVGRIPVESDTRLNNVIDKTIQFENSKYYKTGSYLFVGGSEMTDEELNNLRKETGNEKLGRFATGSYLDNEIIPVLENTDKVERIYCHCHNVSEGPYCAKNTENLISSINKGVGVVTFVGHGTPVLIVNDCCQDSFDVIDINRNLSNYNNYPIFISFSCSNADLTLEEYNLDYKSFGEELICVKDAGAVLFIGASVEGGGYEDFGVKLFRNLKAPKILTIGEAFTKAKRENTLNQELIELINNQYQIFGDPALKLK